ncbi:hypothetical protein [Xenorhabdus bovienii]|uniref:Uncharacterized protein n=1 Tax=Xenorhabdus bovienii TaxID=40576 RepID=A0AAJ1N1K9_XENBV|nr:hypothetical protein [Xenorhabdus bovienii]MDE1480638.1 hypothetical protein [Xenorhabdus bovienii]MDE1488920.1 hypothetical protein [Xenorhabdus bovienii]MDE9512353.1 hypothetical protein [Xenorhabdus bovienii]MDE9523992.1 hypothetical protein [Xenorhabdus bovienii]MDE9532624.1 hypothetical protein [Xenorhabdus bovienii]
MTLYEILKNIYRTNIAIGHAFPRKGKPRSSQGVGKWKKRGVPEDVAILCHVSPDIPYTHEPLGKSKAEYSDLPKVFPPPAEVKS